MKSVKIAIVEDDREVLEVLKEGLGLFEEIILVESFTNAESFIEKLPQIPVDVVLMDINLPGMSGLQAVAKCKQKYPNLQFMMWTSHEDNEHIFEALCVGATGYLLKKSNINAMAEAIFDIYNGGSPMSPAIARRVISSFQSRNAMESELQKLSNREREILKLVADGFKYKAIADQLFISIETVRTHVRNIYDKLQVASRTEMINKLFPNRNIVI